ncbi:MAG: hypothetical protein ACKV2T_17310 [Kofleriaceae bacterium]
MSPRSRYVQTVTQGEAAEDFNTMSRANAVKAFRRLAAASSEPLKTTDLPQGLWYALRRYFGSIDDARVAAGVAGPEHPRRWSKETVAAEIVRLHRKGVRITNLGLKDEHGALLGAITEYFGSIVVARRAARVPEPAPLLVKKRQRWDEARVIAEIEELHRSGESVANSKVPNPLLKAGKRYFGSWKNAIEAAGLNYDEVRLAHEPYTEEDLLEILRDLARDQPEMLLSDLGYKGFFPTILRLFGTLDVALERARVKDWPVRERLRALSKSEALAALRQRERDGLSTARETVREEQNVLYHSGIIHFGEWQRFCDAAGVDTDSHNRSWTVDKLLDALRVRDRRGLSLKPEDVKREDSRLHSSVLAYFGSYVRAVELVADAPWALTRWTPSLVLARLKEAARGRDRLTAREAGGALANACQKYFGSYSAACRAAGLTAIVGLGGAPKGTRRRSKPRRSR